MKLNKKYSIKEIADLYDCQLAGNHAASFDSVSSLINSKPNSISFLSDSSLMKLLNNTNLSCVITTPELSTNISIPMIITDNPQFVFSKIIRENIDFKEARIPVFSNVEAFPRASRIILKENLKKQMTGSVRWRETMTSMIEHKVTKVVEIGPGKVLSNLFRKEHTEINIKNIRSLSDIKKNIKI